MNTCLRLKFVATEICTESPRKRESNACDQDRLLSEDRLNSTFVKGGQPFQKQLTLANGKYIKMHSDSK